ncbi:MAG: hypothetical protein LC100_11265 [Chitinophagales bacterium]|nr:hypothetical protein [Chitinophagales bacterium]
MNLLSWLGLFFLAFNVLFAAIILIGYIRAQWKAVDKEMEEERMYQEAFRERMEKVDDILDSAFKNAEV